MLDGKLKWLIIIQLCWVLRAQRYNFQCKQTGHWRWSHPLLIRWQTTEDDIRMSKHVLQTKSCGFFIKNYCHSAVFTSLWQIKFFFFSCLRIHQRQDLLAALRDLILVGASVGLFLSVVPTSCWYWQFLNLTYTESGVLSTFQLKGSSYSIVFWKSKFTIAQHLLDFQL